MKKVQPKVSEADIKRAIKDYLRYSGWYCFHIQQAMGSHPGIADIFAIKGGRGVWIE